MLVYRRGRTGLVVEQLHDPERVHKRIQVGFVFSRHLRRRLLVTHIEMKCFVDAPLLLLGILLTFLLRPVDRVAVKLGPFSREIGTKRSGDLG